MLFDVLTLQTDRHLDNVCFIFDLKTRHVRPCPLLDNEFAFLGRTLQNIIENADYYKGYRITADDLDFHLRVADNSYRSNIEDIVKIAKNNSIFDKIYRNFVKNMNIDMAIKKLQAQNIEIDNSYIDFMKDIVKSMKKELNKYYSVKEDKDVRFEM